MLTNCDKYKNFLNFLDRKISEKDFKKQFLEVQKIDLNHYSKLITLEELKKYIDEYKNKEFKENEIKKVQVALPGNPEIVFKLCLEAIRYDVNMLIGIEDFCLAQNTFLVEVVNEAIKNFKFKNIIKLKNLLKDKDIIENSKKVDRTICIGNSNLYNRISEKTENLILNPYGIFEIYMDSEEFEELEEKIYEYLYENQFESNMYDDLEFEDTIKDINKNGYGFCSLLISKDKEKIEKFKKDVNSKYVVCNNNPFKEIQFDFEIL